MVATKKRGLVYNPWKSSDEVGVQPTAIHLLLYFLPDVEHFILRVL